ncbi:MAG: GAF domain-containing protein [Calothrix sp. C42_A2020_038]|nr:GAF domain-containing protein [Calothrix sp. C42_A2020_038]
MYKSQLSLSDTGKKRSPLLEYFYNLPINYKQTIALVACQIVSILGLGIGGTLIITQGLRSQILEQAKSEIAVTDINYNIKINQMGFGFRGQSDNPALINAAIAHNSGKTLSRVNRVEIKQILTNEIKAREIEYATLVGRDLRIIVNANANRTGEVFNPDNLVSEVLINARQIKASRVVSWSEISKEAPPLPEGFNNQDALIRYTVTPIKDPATKVVIGALVSGDIINGKNIITKNTLKATNGGYSAIYFQKPDGEFALASSLSQSESQNISQAVPNIELPKNGKSLLIAAAKASEGKVVTGRFVIGTQTYTVAAKALPNKIIENPDEPQVIFADNPTAILVRGTPELALNNLLIQSFLEQLLAVFIALILIGVCAILLRHSIVKPIINLKQVAQQFTDSLATGNYQQIQASRAPIIAKDEIGELAFSFNTMADTIYTQIQQRENQAHLALQLNAITAVIRESLNSEKILKVAVAQTRKAIQAERVLFYSLDQWQSQVVAESVDYKWPAMLKNHYNNPYDIRENIEDLPIGSVKVVENINKTRLSRDSIEYLRQLDIRAYLLAPVFVNKELYGLFVVHQCSNIRPWQDSEINLFKQVAVQIGYALEQSQLLQQVEKERMSAENISQEERRQKENLQMQLIELLKDVEGAVSGDLTVRADVGEGEIGTVADFFNSIVESLRDIVTKVQSTATEVNGAIGSNSEEIRQLAQEALEQSAEINSTLDAVDAMTMQMHSVADNARQASKVASLAARNAEESGQAIDLTVQKIMHLRETVGETGKKVKRLGESTQQISRVVSLINQIAVQTNLLAINAGIEAARAGEEAQGFVVVAEEVSELAARSSSATKEIENILENVQKEASELVQVIELETTQVVEGTRVVEDAKYSLQHILEVSRQVDLLVSSISHATYSQAQTSQIVSTLVKQIAETSRRTSTSSQRISASLQHTVEISQQLQETVETFKVR